MKDLEAGKADRTSGAQAIERALAILDCFSLETPNVSMTEFINQTGLTPSTAHRIVRALERKQFVVRDPDTNQFSVGPAIVELAQIPLRQITSGDLVAVALPYLEKLRALTNETASLHVLMGDRRICLAELVSKEPISMASGVGQIRELAFGAPGKAIAAYLERDAHGQEPNFWLSADAAAQIRQSGYATSFGETVPGASAIAVPIFRPGGSIVGAINVTGPEMRWTKERIALFTTEIIRVVTQLNLRLGAVRTQEPSVEAFS